MLSCCPGTNARPHRVVTKRHPNSHREQKREKRLEVGKKNNGWTPEGYHFSPQGPRSTDSWQRTRRTPSERCLSCPTQSPAIGITVTAERSSSIRKKNS